jgi:hypothetical protein
MCAAASETAWPQKPANPYFSLCFRYLANFTQLGKVPNCQIPVSAAKKIRFERVIPYGLLRVIFLARGALFRVPVRNPEHFGGG